MSAFAPGMSASVEFDIYNQGRDLSSASHARAFLSDREGEDRVYVVNADGSDRRQLVAGDLALCLTSEPRGHAGMVGVVLTFTSLFSLWNALTGG